MGVTLRIEDFSAGDVEDALNAKVGEDGLTFSVEGFHHDEKGMGMMVRVLMGMEDEDEVIHAWKVVGSSVVYEVVEAEEEDEEEEEED